MKSGWSGWSLSGGHHDKAREHPYMNTFFWRECPCRSQKTRTRAPTTLTRYSSKDCVEESNYFTMTHQYDHYHMSKYVRNNHKVGKCSSSVTKITIVSFPRPGVQGTSEGLCDWPWHGIWWGGGLGWVLSISGLDPRLSTHIAGWKAQGMQHYHPDEVTVT